MEYLEILYIHIIKLTFKKKSVCLKNAIYSGLSYNSVENTQISTFSVTLISTMMTQDGNNIWWDMFWHTHCVWTAGQHFYPLSQSAHQQIGKDHLQASHTLGRASIPFRKYKLPWMEEMILLYMEFSHAHLLTVLSSKITVPFWKEPQ